MVLLDRLRDYTRTHHQQLESRLDLLQESFTLDAYIHILKRFYGFYLPLEKDLSKSDEIYNSLINLKFCEKSHRLIQDLQSLGITSEELQRIPICPHKKLPNLTPPAAILGCLYVLEGSALGGQILSRHFKKRFQLSPEAGLSFFYGSGQDTGMVWKNFCGSLHFTFDFLKKQLQFSESELSQNACQGAKETFETLEFWLCHQEEGAFH